jgi:hypothetical protein
MAKAPTLPATPIRTSTPGKKLFGWGIGNELFSDHGEDTSDRTDYHMPTRTETRDNWHTWAKFYNHTLRVELKKFDDLINRADRECSIREQLADAELEERRDWFFDDEEDVLYLADEFFLITWKLSNCKQFEETITCVVYAE